MSGVESLSADEKRAYDLITSQDGMVQSELWKALNADSRTGSRLAKSLTKAGLIERVETTHNGRTTYLLKPTSEEPPSELTSGEEPPPEEGTSTEWQGNRTKDPSTDGETGEDGLTPREERALSLIQQRNGIYQSEFWKELEVSSRTGSRIVRTLEEQDLIRREEATHNGQSTYFLQPATKDLDFSLLMADGEISPFVGAEDEVDPIESEAFSQWMLRLLRDQQ